MPGSQPQPSGQVAAAAAVKDVVVPPGGGIRGWRAALRHARRALTPTPYRLRVVRAVLVALSLVTAAVAAAGVQLRVDATRALLTTSGPLSFHAQAIYHALSDADTTAATGFLSDGQEPAEARDRYRGDIAQATASLTAATSAGGQEAVAGPLHRLNSQLPVYTELVESARVRHRLGQPLGAAYLREASTLLRSRTLPAAEELYATQAERLDDDHARATVTPTATILLGLALLCGLVAAQVHLVRLTRRRLNGGLVVATAAVVVAAGWTAGALVVSSGHLDAGRRDGAELVQALSEVRITALQARADENHSLVNRGQASEESEILYHAKDGLLGDPGGGLLGRAEDLAAASASPAVAAAVAAAGEDLQAWRAAHDAIREADVAGDYGAAVAASIGEDPGSAASAFNQLDGGLAAAIGHAQVTFDREVTAARSELAALPWALGALGIAAAAGAAAGVSQRLREYT